MKHFTLDERITAELKYDAEMVAYRVFQYKHSPERIKVAEMLGWQIDINYDTGLMTVISPTGVVYEERAPCTIPDTLSKFGVPELNMDTLCRLEMKVAGLIYIDELLIKLEKVLKTEKHTQNVIKGDDG